MAVTYTVAETVEILSVETKTTLKLNFFVSFGAVL